MKTKTIILKHARHWALVLLALSTLNSQLSIPLAASSITVNNTNDDGAGTLRQAIQTAVNGDTINFSVSGVITLTNGELLVTKNLTISGPGATVLAISGNTNSRVFEIQKSVTASIAGLTIRDGQATNSAARDGGGIYNGGALTLTACVVIGNTAGAGAYLVAVGRGGGIYNAGTLVLVACTISGNAGGMGGGLGCSYCSGGTGGQGGGIYNAGALVASDCTLSGNRGGSGGFGGGYGAGGSGGAGGGIYNSGSFALNGCTVSGNVGGLGARGRTGSGLQGTGGGIYNAASGSSANLRSSIVAQDSARGYPDLVGPFVSQGHNLIGQIGGSTGFSNGVNHDQVGNTNAPLDPLLGPLQHNGGPTFTHALLAGSPALDAGDDALLDAPFNLTTDQRGLPRKSGALVDIGAFELQISTRPSLTGMEKLNNGAFQFSFTNTPGASFTVLCATNVSLPVSNWTALGAPTEIAPGQFQFTDTQATNGSSRVYCVRAP